MKLIKVNTVEVQVEEQTILKIREYVTMNTNQEIFIRDKKEAAKLSKKIIRTSDEMRIARYAEAVSDNDTLYLNSLYNSLSLKELLELLALKAKKHL